MDGKLFEELSHTNEEEMTNMSRADGLVDIEAREAAGLAMTTMAKDLLQDGYDREDTLEYLTLVAKEAVANAEGEMGEPATDYEKGEGRVGIDRE